MRHGKEKETFETGAQRDTDDSKGRPSLISPVLIHRLGVLLAKGADHYGADNWVKGMPFRRTADSMIRHIFQWLAGDDKEDHLASVCFGAMCLMHYEEAMKDGYGYPGRAIIDDRCVELKRILNSLLTTPAVNTKLEPEPLCNGCTYAKAFNNMTCMTCGRSNHEYTVNR